MNTASFYQSQANIDGGFMWITGTIVDINIQTFILDHSSTKTGNGAGFHLTNTGATTIDITTGTLGSIFANQNGGFIY